MSKVTPIRGASGDDPEERLQAALAAAQNTAHLRERALTLAVGHFGKRATYTTNAGKIVEMAGAFYDFLVAASK